MTTQPPNEAWITLASAEETAALHGTEVRVNPATVLNMGRLLHTHPRIGPRFSALLREIMTGPGPLDAAERQMVASVAAAAQDCTY